MQRHWRWFQLRPSSERGFSVARGADGSTLASIADFTPGRAFTLRVRDGDVDATAIGTRPWREPRAPRDVNG